MSSTDVGYAHECCGTRINCCDPDSAADFTQLTDIGLSISIGTAKPGDTTKSRNGNTKFFIAVININKNRRISRGINLDV